MEEIYEKWEDSFVQIWAFKEEVLKRNPGTIVDIKTELVVTKKKMKQNEQVHGSRHFQRFFVAISACTNGFLMGYRPYIGLDACHLKGKWKVCLVVATAIDGNNWMFPIAFVVMENESEESWD
jgi:MULE transposase domain